MGPDLGILFDAGYPRLGLGTDLSANIHQRTVPSAQPDLLRNLRGRHGHRRVVPLVLPGVGRRIG